MRIAVALAGLALVGCGDDALPVAQLQDPDTCLECHSVHYDQWSGSMHAYASTDPIFRAMHERGQRETNGELGLFCVNCHAPMAVRNGTITEANVSDFDFETLERTDNGITCYFCHNVDRVTGEHNNPLEVAMDQTMRGGVKNPVDSPAHHSAHSPILDGSENQSEMCGACHDIVNPLGVHIERTFDEWKHTIFGSGENPNIKLTCSSCHMEPTTDVIADKPGLEVVPREYGFHDHTMPGIDQATTPFPQLAEQTAGIIEFLTPAIGIIGPKPRTGRTPGGICLDPPGNLTVRVDSFNVGHSFPSGAAFDRRVWLEVVAYDAASVVLFQSGVVPDGMDPEEIGDPNLFGLWDRATKTNGMPAHFLWEVAAIDPKPNQLLKGPVTLDQTDPRYDHSIIARYNNVPNYQQIDRIEARLRMRALPFAVISDLVASGDLAPGFETKVPTLEIGSSTWLLATKGMGAAMFTNCNPM